MMRMHVMMYENVMFSQSRKINPGLLLESNGKSDPLFPLGMINKDDSLGISSFRLRIFYRGSLTPA